MKKISLSILTFVFTFIVFGQTQLKTINEYKANIPKYEDWLQSNNLNKYLSVQTFEKVNDELFQLYLKFNIDYDSVEVYWNSINSKLQKQRGYGLDSLLYFAGINAFRIPPDNFNIIIYYSYLVVP